jgi:hypothetical protein
VSLRAFLTGCGFNEELLPSLHFVVEDLDLTKTPICLDMPNVGAKYGGVRMPHYHWQEQHNHLSAAIFALLTGRDVISMSAIKANKTLTHYHFSASGFRVRQELIRMHHPRLNNTHAPDYMQVKEVCPRMKPHLVPGEQLESLMSYFMDFVNWESQLRLYHEAKDLRDSELHLLFIRGLAEVFRLHVTQEEGDFLVFSQKYRCCKYEPPAHKNLHAHAIYDRLHVIIHSLDQEERALAAKKKR